MMHLSALFVLMALASGPEAPPALKGLDPVALTEGREIPGREEAAITRGAYRYLFASAESQARFEADPERYAIQIGGACSKMGPLSGKGDPERFHVHEGRIYIFASESCRDSFKASPAKFIDTPDTPPVGTAAEGARARELLSRAVVALGGAERLASLTAVTVKEKVTYVRGIQSTPSTREAVHRFPSGYREVEDWGTGPYGWELGADGGFLTAPDERERAEPSVVAFMERQVAREPLVLLASWQRGEAVAFAAGSGKVGEAAVERVALSLAGATTTLAIDPASGRILEAAYRGRGSRGLADLQKRYSDFREVNGLTVPFEVETWQDGEAVASPKVVIEVIQVEGESKLAG